MASVLRRFIEVSNTFDQNHLGLRRGLPQRFGSGILGRMPPLAGLFDRRKFDNHESLGRPRSLEYLDFAATHQKPAAVGCQSWQNGFAVILITNRIVNLNID